MQLISLGNDGGGAKTASVEMSAPTQGWLAVAFVSAPSGGGAPAAAAAATVAHAGMDVYSGGVYALGVVQVVDGTSWSETQPTKDTRNDVDLASVMGSKNDGTTTVSFRRKLHPNPLAMTCAGFVCVEQTELIPNAAGKACADAAKCEESECCVDTDDSGGGGSGSLPATCGSSWNCVLAGTELISDLVCPVAGCNTEVCCRSATRRRRLFQTEAVQPDVDFNIGAEMIMVAWATATTAALSTAHTPVTRGYFGVNFETGASVVGKPPPPAANDDDKDKDNDAAADGAPATESSNVGIIAAVMVCLLIIAAAAGMVYRRKVLVGCVPRTRATPFICFRFFFCFFFMLCCSFARTRISRLCTVQL
jgi:hypothetical protein